MPWGPGSAGRSPRLTWSGSHPYRDIAGPLACSAGARNRGPVCASALIVPAGSRVFATVASGSRKRRQGPASITRELAGRRILRASRSRGARSRMRFVPLGHCRPEVERLAGNGESLPALLDGTEQHPGLASSASAATPGLAPSGASAYTATESNGHQETRTNAASRCLRALRRTRVAPSGAGSGTDVAPSSVLVMACLGTPWLPSQLHLPYPRDRRRSRRCGSAARRRSRQPIGDGVPSSVMVPRCCAAWAVTTSPTGRANRLIRPPTRPPRPGPMTPARRSAPD